MLSYVKIKVKIYASSINNHTVMQGNLSWKLLQTHHITTN